MRSENRWKMRVIPLQESEHAAKSGRGRQFPSWIHTWEIYPIVGIAGFLRLYQINTGEFDGDQAALFRMAHDAIAYHLLPATGIVSSIRVMNPPAAVYFLLFPALLSADPLWGTVLVGVVNTLAVLLTYLFTRRYYGRAAGVIAALLYATALRPVEYSRFIWQQNLLPPLVILFMFALFRGAVERRKDWFFPATLLLGLLYQLHELTLVLAVPFLLACVLAPGTIRKRDLALSTIALVIIFFPYLLWENATHFVDVSIALSTLRQPSSIDNQAISIYQLFLSPYAHNLLNPHDVPPDDPHSILRRLVPLLSWLHDLLPWLLIGGFATAVLTFIRTKKEREYTVRAMLAGNTGIAALRRWWQQLRADPGRYGYLLLLSWQIVPLLALSRHSVTIQTHYLIMLMPGQFILIALFLARIFAWAQHWGSRGGSRAEKAFWLRYGITVLVCLIVTVQLAGTTAEVVDSSRGSFNAHALQPIPAFYFSDLSSQEQAIKEADQVALSRHLHRVYIATDTSDEAAMRYLAEQIQTPNTLFSAENCLVLPALDAGPVVFLVGPDDRLANTLLGQFARITLVDRPPHLGGPPYRLYIVSPPPGISSREPTFVNHLQLLDAQSQQFHFNSATHLLTRWRLLHSEPPHMRTTYTYTLLAHPGGANNQAIKSQCTFTSLWTGDQLLATFTLASTGLAPSSIAIQLQTFTTTPYTLTYGPFSWETGADMNTPTQTLQTADGGSSIILPVNASNTGGL